MSATSLTSKLLDLKRSFESIMGNIPQKLRHENPFFTNYTADAQAAEIRTAQAKERASAAAKLDPILKDIGTERRSVPREIGKIKFPFTASDDTSKKGIGENQLAAARFFLASQPKPQALGSEIRQGLTLGRIDYVWALIDHVQAELDKNKRSLSPEEMELRTELSLVLEDLEGAAKIVGLEREARSLDEVATAGLEFQRQLSAGAEHIFLAEVFPLLTEDERTSEMQYLHVSGNLTQSVAMKRRVAEVMQRSAG